jgi:hypothetical protein
MNRSKDMWRGDSDSTGMIHAFSCVSNETVPNVTEIDIYTTDATSPRTMGCALLYPRRHKSGIEFSILGR